MNVYPTVEDLKLAREHAAILHAMKMQALGYGASPAPPADQWAALVASKEAAGMSRVNAIVAAARERRDLYEAQSIPKAQFRASR
jgi:hypothetical protein